MHKRKFIAVNGSGQATAQEAGLVEAVGQEIAKHGVVLVCGGLGGVMEAACRGTTEAGGLTIGILPGDSRETANPYLQIPLVTVMGLARNVIEVRSAQAVIAIGDSYDTRSEIGDALQASIALIALNTWSLCKRSQRDIGIITAKTPAEVVALAFNLIN